MLFLSLPHLPLNAQRARLVDVQSHRLFAESQKHRAAMSKCACLTCTPSRASPVSEGLLRELCKATHTTARSTHCSEKLWEVSLPAKLRQLHVHFLRMRCCNLAIPLSKARVHGHIATVHRSMCCRCALTFQALDGCDGQHLAQGSVESLPRQPADRAVRVYLNPLLAVLIADVSGACACIPRCCSAHHAMMANQPLSHGRLSAIAAESPARR